MRHLVRDVAAFDDFVRLGEPGIGITEHMVIILLNVVRLVVVYQVSGRLHRLFRIEVSRQRLVLDFDQLHRVLSRLLIDGDDATNVVAHIPDFIHRQRRLVMPNRKDAVFIRRVGSDDHAHHALEQHRLPRIDLLDARVRQRCVQDLSNEHSRDRQVVGVLPRARSLPRGIDHRDPLPDHRELVPVLPVIAHLLCATSVSLCLCGGC